MPKRPLTLCRKPGCSNLVERPGYCFDHRLIPQERKRAALAELDKLKTIESKDFYAGRRWTETSLRHRQLEPLCRRCKVRGLIVAAQMVHHNPPVEELIARGLSPYSSQYLESLCNNCHLEELRAKRKA